MFASGSWSGASTLRVVAVNQYIRLEGQGVVGPTGVAELPAIVSDEPQASGLYEVVFHVGPYYRARGEALPTPAFLEEVPYVFGIANPEQHYHLPFKVTPWGFSLFRGGA